MTSISSCHLAEMQSLALPMTTFPARDYLLSHKAGHPVLLIMTRSAGSSGDQLSPNQADQAWFMQSPSSCIKLPFADHLCSFLTWGRCAAIVQAVGGGGGAGRFLEAVTCPLKYCVALEPPGDPVCACQLSCVPLGKKQPQALPLVALCVCIPAAGSVQGAAARGTVEETVGGDCRRYCCG